VREINALERTPDWSSTAVIIAYDDSDGWYDHQFSGVHNPSLSPADNLSDTVFGIPQSGQCGPKRQVSPPLAGEQGRCGFGPRLPLLVVSPLAGENRVDHHASDQSSILNLIEYNWGLPGIPGSFDQILSARDRAERIPFDLAGLFRFGDRPARTVFLNPATGQPRH
jgi:phospholipase C